jgi:predicted O-methyltransferase YrrM
LEDDRLITDTRLTNFIRSLEPDGSENLERIRREALAAEVPIIRDETAALLKCFIRMMKPERILEVGTAVGYSALLMAEVMPESAEIVTIENYPPRIEIAEKNLRESPYRDRIQLRTGDAGEILSELAHSDEQFPFIFLDAAKGQYPVWFPDLLSMLPSGGVLMSDNILQDGSIIESRYVIERRERTIHQRMRDYLFTLKHSEELETAILTVGDGVAVSVKK